MSLINDALKKAARQRAQEEADVETLMPGGGAKSHGRAPVRTQNMVLVGGAAIALVVVSAVVTGIFVSGRSEPKAAASPTQSAAPREQPAPESHAAAVRVPQISVSSPPAAHAPPQVVETPAAEAPARTRAATVAATPVPSAQVTVHVPEMTPPATAAVSTGVVQAPARSPGPSAAPPAAPATTPPPAPATTPLPVVAAAPPAVAPAVVQSLGERVQAFIDRIQISGVRYAGADSKAIIDGHIYRVNDLLERTLGIRLSKFDQDHLTFVDPTGSTYVKSF
jgi:hypothetical protein